MSDLTGKFIRFRDRGKGNRIVIKVDSITREYTSPTGSPRLVVVGLRYSPTKKHFFGSLRYYVVDPSECEEVTQ